MNQPDENEILLNQLLHGEAGPEAFDLVAAAAERDPEFASRLGEELEFSELVRQALIADRVDSGSAFVEAMDAANSEPEQWKNSVIAGEPTRAECDRLALRLWENPGEARDFRTRLAEDEWLAQVVSGNKSESAFLKALETRMWATTVKDHFVDDLAARLDEEDRIREATDPDNVVRASFGESFATIARVAAVAAVVAIGAFFGAKQLAGGFVGEGSAVATVTKSSSDARWSGAAPDSEGKVRSGQYRLDSGVVSMKMASGGEMTVEGPAIFSLDEDSSAFVYHGVAMAKSATPDTGVTLRSKGLSVANPAALVGIDARSHDSTEAIVFSGDGGFCLPDGGCRSLYQHEAVKADLIRDRFVDIPYNPQPFARSWELLAGVEKNIGSVRIELPGTEIEPDRKSRGEVQVFVENESFQPAGEMEVDAIAVGEFAQAESNPGQALQASGDLRSYLLQLWPSEGKEGEVEASLTFDHPVVGVIYSSDRLTGSDSFVGTSMTHVGEAFDRGRGLDSGSDQILLSDDRRTLNVRLRGGELEVDQIRVLVALN